MAITIANLATGDVISESFTDSVTNALNRKGLSISRVANQSIPSGTGTYTAISWDTEVFDTDGFFAPTSTNITIPVNCDGFYFVVGILTWASSPGANSTVEVLLNSTLAQREAIGAAPQMVVHGYEGGFYCAAGDVLQVRVSQGSGGAINLTGTCQIVRVSL